MTVKITPAKCREEEIGEVAKCREEEIGEASEDVEVAERPHSQRHRGICIDDRKGIRI